MSSRYNSRVRKSSTIGVKVLVNKVSFLGRRDDMAPPPLMAVRRFKKIAADLRPPVDESTLRTSLVAGGGPAAGSQHAHSLGSCTV